MKQIVKQIELKNPVRTKRGLKSAPSANEHTIVVDAKARVVIIDNYIVIPFENVVYYHVEEVAE